MVPHFDLNAGFSRTVTRPADRLPGMPGLHLAKPKSFDACFTRGQICTSNRTLQVFLKTPGLSPLELEVLRRQTQTKPVIVVTVVRFVPVPVRRAHVPHIVVPGAAAQNAPVFLDLSLVKKIELPTPSATIPKNKPKV
jgi:hypothetical protein